MTKILSYMQQLNDTAYHMPFASANYFSTWKVKTAKQLLALQMFPCHPNTAAYGISDKNNMSY